MLKVLHIEDDLDDVDLLREAFQDNNIEVTTEVIIEGNKVMPWFEAGNKLPDVIVMDLNLPKMHGKDILLKLKANSATRNIPLVVLTTSSSADDRNYCLDKGADAFITKPSTVEGFNEAVARIVAVANNRK